MQSVGQKMARGAVWMLLFKLSGRSLGLISTIILARLLMPADFGLVAMAMSIVAILEIFGTFSFDIVLIQNPESGRDQYDTAWTFNVLVAMGSGLLLVLLAIPASYFYNEPRLEVVMYWLAIGFCAQGFQNIGVVEFRKQLDFNKEFIFLFGKKVISFSVTVPLAFYLHNYWALVIGTVTGKLASVVLSFLIQSYRPRFSLRATQELFHFSKWLLFNNLLVFFRFRSADFIIGRLLGTTSLGIYNVAFEISNLPTTEMIAPINRAVFPGYVKMAHDLATLRQGFLSVIGVITMFSLPAGLGIAALADLIVKVFLGDRWLDAIPIIQILALFGSITALTTNIGSVFLSLKMPKTLTYIYLLQLLFQIPLLIFLSISHGLMGAAWSYLIATCMITPIAYVITFRIIELSFLTYFSSVWRSFVSVTVMYFGVMTSIAYAEQSLHITNNIVLLFLGILIGAVLYSAVIYILWVLSSRPDGAEQYFLDKTTKFIKSKYLNKPAV